MSFLTQSHQVFFRRPLCLIPSASRVIQHLTQSLSSSSRVGNWHRTADIKGVTSLSLFGSLSGLRKDEVQRVIPAGWLQAGHPATKILCFISPLFNMEVHCTGCFSLNGQRGWLDLTSRFGKEDVNC